jgi:hypothetical protein
MQVSKTGLTATSQKRLSDKSALGKQQMSLCPALPVSPLESPRLHRCCETFPAGPRAQKFGQIGAGIDKIEGYPATGWQRRRI